MDKCHIEYTKIKPDLIRMWNEINSELSKLVSYIPEDKSCILNSLTQSPRNVRLIILGLDPYPEGAIGYPFETPDGKLTKRSLEEIAKNLSCSIGVDMSNITRCSFRNVPGIYTINAAWTLRSKSGEHVKLWSKFISRVINFVIDTSNVQVMIMFGSPDQYKPLTELLKPIHIVKSYHPVARGGLFMKPHNRPFAEAHYIMKYKLVEEIDWYKCFTMTKTLMKSIIIPESEIKSQSRTYHLLMLKDQMRRTSMINLDDPNCYLGDIPSREYNKLKSLYDNTVASIKRFDTKAKLESSSINLKQTYEFIDNNTNIECNYNIESLMCSVILTMKTVFVRLLIRNNRVVELNIPFLTKEILLRFKITNTIKFYTFRNQSLAYWLLFELFVAKNYIYDHQELLEILINDMYLVVQVESTGKHIYSDNLTKCNSKTNILLIPNVSTNVKPIYKKCTIFSKQITSAINLYTYNNDQYISPRIINNTTSLSIPYLITTKDLKSKINTDRVIEPNKLESLRFHKKYSMINIPPGNIEELYINEFTQRISSCLNSIKSEKLFTCKENKHSILDMISISNIDKFSCMQIDNDLKHKLVMRNNQIVIIDSSKYDKVVHRVNSVLKSMNLASKLICS